MKTTDVKQMKVSEVNTPDKVYLLKAIRVKEHGAESAKAFEKGDVVTVSGKDKYVLLSRNVAEIYDAKKHEKAK